MKRDFWGNEIVKVGEYHVFHDESLPEKRWLIIGLLFIKSHDIDIARKILYRIREEENYFREIHFKELPKSFSGKYGAKARIAKKWMIEFRQRLSEIANFSCLIVDRYSSAYEHSRFSKDFHEYNRFTAMALKAGINWHILQENEYDRLEITFITDKKNRSIIDNFEKYIQQRARYDSILQKEEKGNYPEVILKVVPKDSSGDDLLQLTDLLIGSTQAALLNKVRKPTKRELASFIVRWVRKDQYRWRRKFNLWGFPDAEGRPYTNIYLKMRENEPNLFDNIRHKKG